MDKPVEVIIKGRILVDIMSNGEYDVKFEGNMDLLAFPVLMYHIKNQFGVAMTELGAHERKNVEQNKKQIEHDREIEAKAKLKAAEEKQSAKKLKNIAAKELADKQADLHKRAVIAENKKLEGERRVKNARSIADVEGKDRAEVREEGEKILKEIADEEAVIAKEKAALEGPVLETPKEKSEEELDLEKSRIEAAGPFEEVSVPPENPPTEADLVKPPEEAELKTTLEKKAEEEKKSK